MPQLRFSKDARGYENTFVVHGSKGKGKGRPRILYWFRTPPGVRVGRTALDEDAIRIIEATHPDIQFDWPQILKGKGDTSVERPTHEDRGDRQARPVEKPDRRSRGDRGGRRDTSEPRRQPTGAAAPAEQARVQPPAPTAIEEAVEETGPAAVRLGTMGLKRLRARYADMIARITERVGDETLRQELTALAQRLNPDDWLTEADVSAGLESYEATFEAVKTAIGGRRSNPEPPGEPAG